MDTITRRAYAKINLILDITGRRENGYHDLRTVMQTVDVCDTLTFTKTADGAVTLTTSSELIPQDADNLIVRALTLLLDTYGIREGVAVDLTKEIPVAAGMAGGSADAACALKAANELFSLGLSHEALADLGVTLGADIPYCIRGGTCLAEGIGEVLTPLPAPPACTLVIAKPAASVSTALVYRQYDAAPAAEHPDVDALCDALSRSDLRALAAHTGNVLEPVTLRQVPVIADIKNLMLDYGALSALMSGSGPSVYGIFESETDAIKAYHVLKARRIAPSLFVSRFVQG